MNCNCNDTNGAISICQDNNIAQVDNSALECQNGFYSTKCIINSSALPFLSLPENSSVEEVISALISSLTYLSNRVQTLENTN